MKKMTEKEYMLAAAQGDPAKESLIFADWLTDRNNPGDQERADFIRLQCKIEGMENSDPQKTTLQEEAAAMLPAQRAYWKGQFGTLFNDDEINSLQFSHGFPLLGDYLKTGGSPATLLQALDISPISLNLRGQNGSTMLMNVIIENDAATFGELMKRKPDLDIQDNFGRTALMQAITSDRPAMFDAVLKRKPNLDIQDKLGWTAMMHSIVRNSPPKLNALLKNNANVDIQDHRGRTVLMHAIQTNNEPVMFQAILKHNPRLDLTDEHDRTAWDMACDRSDRGNNAFKEGLERLSAATKRVGPQRPDGTRPPADKPPQVGG